MRVYRYVLIFLAALWMGGCATTVDQQQLTAMKSSDEGIALINMIIDGYPPNAVQVVLVQADAAGKFAYNNAFDLWRPLVFMRDSKKEPAQLRVAAGTYGIFEIRSAGKQYRARAARSNLLMSIAEQPIAAFTVGPGEVVNAGTLQLLSMPSSRQTLVGRAPSGFTAHVGSMPPDRLQNLFNRNPELANAVIQRPMVAPGSPG